MSELDSVEGVSGTGSQYNGQTLFRLLNIKDKEILYLVGKFINDNML